MIIRKAKMKDSKNIAAVSLCVWIDTYANEGVRDNMSEYVLSEYRESKIESMIEYQNIYIAEKNQHILGYIALNYGKNQKYEIKNLYVLPKLQKNNIGRKLVEKAVSLSNGDLWLSCWENNTNAICFYKAMGFVEFGEKIFQLGVEKHRNVLFNLGT